MVEDELIENVRLMSGDTTSTDAEILTALHIARHAIITRRFPYAGDIADLDVEPQYQMIQCSIANYVLAKRGAEGETAHAENGITRTYGGTGTYDIPESMLSHVVPMMGVPL